MKYFDRRHLSTLGLSLFGLILSIIFLSPKNISTQKIKTINLALLEDANEKIIRQRVNSLAWETIEVGELLALGEKVKTSEKANATIKFLKSNTKINLTKNSTIVIEESGENFKLRLLEGNIYVKNLQGNKKTDLEIITGKDGKESIKLNDAEATLSVSKNGAAELNIIKGNVEASKAVKVNNAAFFGNLYPNYGETIYLDKNHSYSLINLKSKNLSIINFGENLKNDYEYTIEYSGSENEMPKKDLLTENSNLPLLTNQQILFWKIIAKKTDGSEITESPTMKFNIKDIEPPSPQYPQNLETIRYVDNQKIKSEFKWTLPTPLDQIEIEISKDENFNELISKDKVTVKTYFETELLTEEGQYFWRVKGQLKNQKAEFQKEISSNIFTFHLKKGLKLKTPTIISPSHKQLYYIDESKSMKNIVLSWSDIREASFYSILLKSEGFSKILEAKNNYLELEDLKIGKYIWTVKARNQKDVDSDDSESFEFTILPNLDLKILTSIPQIHYYTDKVRSIPVEWQNISNAKAYDIIVKNSNVNDEDKITTFTTNKGSINFESTHPVQVQILAKNSLNEIIAKSKTFKITPTIIPIPEAPIFTTREKIIVADNDGNLTIPLELTNSNHPTLIYYLTNLETMEKSESELPGNTTFIKMTNLTPGKYKLYAQYIDLQKRLGLKSQEFEIIVKNESSIMAPKIKKVNIK